MPTQVIQPIQRPPELAEFMAALDDINAQAEAAPGLVWRLQSDSGNGTDIRVAGVAPLNLGDPPSIVAQGLQG